jgi:hypothetical protein
MIYHSAVQMNQRVKQINERLRVELNKDARVIDYGDVFLMLDCLRDLSEQIRADMVDALREQEKSWEQISILMGLNKQTVYGRYR